MNGFTYAVKHEATILYSAVSETDSHICIVQCNVNIRVQTDGLLKASQGSRLWGYGGIWDMSRAANRLH
jgi:hypothetical protein